MRVLSFGLLVACAMGAALADVDLSLVHVVDFAGDSVAPSILFRGNTPLSDDGKSVPYEQWFSTMNEVAREQLGSSLVAPGDLFIVDVGFEDASDVTALAEFWANPTNAAKGEYKPWPYSGLEQYPPSLTPTEQSDVVHNSSLWDSIQFPSRVHEIRRILLEGPPAGYKQLAIYAHCASGWNKIGAFIDAYRVSHFRKINSNGVAGSFKAIAAPPSRVADSISLTSIYAMGCKEGLRCPVKPFTSIVGWYCLWSNAFLNSSFTDCDSGYTCAASACLPVM